MFTKMYLKDLAERAISTAAEAAIAAWGIGQISAFDADWKFIGGMALSAGFLSVAKSLYARNHGLKENASLVK